MRSNGHRAELLTPAESSLSSRIPFLIGSVVTRAQMRAMGGPGFSRNRRECGGRAAGALVTRLPEKHQSDAVTSVDAACVLRNPIEPDVLLDRTDGSLRG